MSSGASCAWTVAPFALETKPYELLRVFLHHPGETLSKDELIEAVWPGRVVTEGVLAKCVTKLRGALGDDEQQIIRTLHGYGYRWIAQLSTRTATGVVPFTGAARRRRIARAAALASRTRARCGRFRHRVAGRA